MAGIGAVGSYGGMSGYYSIYQNRNIWQNRSGNPTSTGPVGAVSRAMTTPVPPVDRLPAVHRGAAQMAPEEEQAGQSQFPTMREGADPAEMAVRARIQYLGGEEQDELLGWGQSNGLEKLLGGEEASNQVKLPWEKSADDLMVGEDDSKTPQQVMEESECQTCKNRKYQDDSDDPGVSFQTPTNVAPEQAAAAVRGHEQEHVVREQAKAQRDDRKVVSQSVTIHTEICPECGDVYVSGGTTRTVTKANPVQEMQQENNDKKPAFEAVA